MRTTLRASPPRLCRTTPSAPRAAAAPPQPLATRLQVGAAKTHMRLTDALVSPLGRLAGKMFSAQELGDNAGVFRSVPYVDEGSPAQTLDFYYPRDVAVHRPLVLYIHGGGFAAFSKDTHWMMAAPLVRAGYAVAMINYRSALDAPYPAALDDVADALTFLRAYAGDHNCRAEELIVAGESSGANLALATALCMSFVRPEAQAQRLFAMDFRLRAVLPACGTLHISDLSRFAGVGSTPGWMLAHAANINGLYLGTCAPQLRQLADPLLLLEQETEPARQLPPFFVSCGGDDPLIGDTQRLQAALRRRGVPVEARYYPRAGHAFEAMWWTAAAQQRWRDTRAFLQAHID